MNGVVNRLGTAAYIAENNGNPQGEAAFALDVAKAINRYIDDDPSIAKDPTSYQWLMSDVAVKKIMETHFPDTYKGQAISFIVEFREVGRAQNRRQSLPLKVYDIAGIDIKDRNFPITHIYCTYNLGGSSKLHAIAGAYPYIESYLKMDSI